MTMIIPKRRWQSVFKKLNQVFTVQYYILDYCNVWHAHMASLDYGTTTGLDTETSLNLAAQRIREE